MNIIQQSALPMLIKAALADVQFKVAQGIWKAGIQHQLMDESQPDSILYPSEKWGTTTEHRFDRNHPYLQACDEAREMCVALGRFCRKFNLDPSTSPLVKNLYFKSFFEEKFELGRVVVCTELTPAVLHDAVEKRNVLHWGGWTITAGKRDFSTDAYGVDEYIRPLIAKHESGELEIELWMPGQFKDRAREAYLQITGSAFAGEDGLGPDPRHMCEPYLEDDEIRDFDDPDSDHIDCEDLIDLMVFDAKQEINHMCEEALQRIACDMPL
ncbi:hypothetical protein [Pseudomonas sp. MWU12-2323]|uniref:hypothetical protein n=1 Tax=Pseudomonas sp. MWU12-2323 TaxID=2651296 RepID=UPI00128B75FD|nr:hypothetical protein [Pseudomonas sp. MWU12-2323]MPQ71535.1 hypothetical protein [Pseudomonas sp. MWU12-2323]